VNAAFKCGDAPPPGGGGGAGGAPSAIGKFATFRL
jgi:hypothetical protein